ncbi:hypothetical protein [Streptomyces sp. NPDC053427]
MNNKIWTRTLNGITWGVWTQVPGDEKIVSPPAVVTYRNTQYMSYITI